MIEAVGQTVSKIGRRQFRRGQVMHNETDYNSLKCTLGLYRPILLNLNVYLMACLGEVCALRVLLVLYVTLNKQFV